MKLPLVILAICSVGAGFIPFSSFVTSDGAPISTHGDLAFSVLPVSLAAGGIFLAWVLYRKENDKPQRIAFALGGIYRTAYRKFYIDEIYLFVTKKIVFNLLGRPAAWIDKNIVDGSMNLLAFTTGKTSAMIKGMQSGRVQQYALYFFGGVAGLAILFIYLWK